MFFPDLAKATAEFARMLRPGGRLCSSVWVKPEENPWTTIVMQAIATEVVLVPAGPDGPNMFRCAAPGHVSALYEAAGLRDVAEWEVGVELVTRPPAQYWEMITSTSRSQLRHFSRSASRRGSGSRKPSSPRPAATNKTAG
jgi:SAM-dependent methyltransferase